MSRRAVLPRMVDRFQDYGRGVVKISLSGLDTEEQETREHIAHFSEVVKTAVTAKDFKPPMLPEVVIRLSEMVNKTDVSIKEVEGAVVRDPTVAARIVAVANSVFYSRGASVRSLKEAIMRLGLAEVRDVAFQAVAKTTIFRAPGFSDRMRELFDAAQAAGLFARQICKILKFQSESAYLCGLLHDMGEAIILGVAVPRAKDSKPLTPVEKEALLAAVQLYHAQIGAMVASMWGLPEMVCDAVLHHHNPHKSENPSQMALVTAVADLLLTHVGLGVPQRTILPLQEPLFYQLNLSSRDVEGLLKYAEEVIENRDSLDPS